MKKKTRFYSLAKSLILSIERRKQHIEAVETKLADLEEWKVILETELKE